MKRLLTLSTFLLLSIMTFASTLVNGIYYEFSGTEATVVSGTYKYTGDVIIPASVTVGEKTYSVTKIGGNAFFQCNALGSVVIPNSVTTIESMAFYGCQGLTSITVGDGVVNLRGDAFLYTPWYENQPDGLVYAGKVAYKYKGTMPANTSISLKPGTLAIASLAFAYCSDLTSITIPNSVTSIGYQAFDHCTGLTSVTIPNSVTSIGHTAFACCSGLTSVTIGNSVTSIGSDAFRGCSGLTSITIPNSVTSIGSDAFAYCSGLTSVTIPNSVTSIGGYAFRGCSGLTSVTIGNSVTSIGGYAFDGCTGLTNIDIPNSVTSIGERAFQGCSGLTSVTIGNGVTSIISYAFQSCTSLKSVIIGSNVTSIGSCVFYQCSSLNKIYSLMENPPLSIYDNYPFSSETYTKATLYVPTEKIDKHRNTNPWSHFSSIVEIVGVVTLNSEGYATFSNASDVEVDGAEVYTATNNGNYIQCTKVEQTVPAYNGVILKGEPNAIVTLFASSGLSDYTNNELKATTTVDGLAEKETALVLSGKKFVNYTGTAFVADKAYMPYDGNSANAIEIVFDDATAINSIASENDLLDGAIIKTIENGTLVIKTANGKYSSVGAKMK